MLRRAFFCASLALATTASPRAAHACGECVCFDHDLDLVPRYSKSLPLNARLFASLPGSDPASVRWTREVDQADVAVDLIPAGGPANAFWISPHDPLEPDTAYRITTVPGGEAVQLTTGKLTDTTAPTAVHASIVDRSATAACWSGIGAVLRIDKSVGSDPAAGELVQLDVTGQGGTERLFFRAGVGLPYEVPFGAVTADNQCLGALALKDARLGETYTAKVTAFDLAGNGLSFDVPPFQLANIAPGSCGPSDPGGAGSAGGAGGAAAGEATNGGCAVRAGAAQGLGALVPLALLAFARLGSRRAQRSGARRRESGLDGREPRADQPAAQS